VAVAAVVVAAAAMAVVGAIAGKIAREITAKRATNSVALFFGLEPGQTQWNNFSLLARAAWR
jgi:hypothetical protein